MLKKFTVFGVTFYSYPLMLFVGLVAFFLWGYIVLARVEKEREETLYKTTLVSIPAIGLLALAAFLLNSLFHSIEEGRISFGGITWAGGVLGGFLAFPLLTHLFVKEKRGEEIAHFSHLVPGIVLGHAFGRVGCFLAGCCYGTPTGFLGVVYPPLSLPAQAYPDMVNTGYSLPLLPTQLFEAGFELLLFVVMVVFYRRLRDHNVSVYLVAYGIFRFVLELFRGDNRGDTGFFLTPSQLLSVVFIIAGIALAVWQYRRAEKRKRDVAEEPANEEAPLSFP